MRRTDGRWDLHSRPLVEARCRDCPWQAYTANGHAIAAIHSRKRSHDVEVQVTMLYRYGSPEPPRA